MKILIYIEMVVDNLFLFTISGKNKSQKLLEDDTPILNRVIEHYSETVWSHAVGMDNGMKRSS